ncbi:hypothetical protein LSM04_002186 [Trypanosoma melophagium]|uniref:uncharacterized protein n=1 Tax=Trypanosoma melophagium TaxID=715481 RepID=UPI00351A78E0|nr:hypothetical protein LSM04_002186 [Trypanosoma melophagium]
MQGWVFPLLCNVGNWHSVCGIVSVYCGMMGLSRAHSSGNLHRGVEDSIGTGESQSNSTTRNTLTAQWGMEQR